jgi:hypothetical protein
MSCARGDDGHVVANGSAFVAAVLICMVLKTR